MLNILLTGVGGQGTVLAAKVLAAAAESLGWQVRTAETIGMAQRGGSVVSHVRMGNAGEEVLAPLVTRGSADLIIAFEPAEAARVLPYLAPSGRVVTATTPVVPVTASLGAGYDAESTIARLASILGPQRFTAVDDAALCEKLTGGRKVLNTALCATAIAAGNLPLNIADLKSAIQSCVKPKFIDMNLQAIDTAVEAFGERK